MPKPDLLKDRDKRIAKRKLKKEKLDEMFDLAADSDRNYIRLLDEGMITYSDGSPYFYIKKGTLENLVANMKDDYVGSINLGHMDFARFPFILGTWRKKDLRITDIGNGRKALDVSPHFDNDSMFIKEIKRLPYDLAVSAQFNAHSDWGLSEKYGVEIVDEIYPEDFNFAIVGEPGNVNSAGLRLAVKGENMTLEELSAAIDTDNTDLEALNALLDTHEEAPEEEAHEEAAVETPEENHEEAHEEAAEQPDEETAETHEEAAEADETHEEAAEDNGALTEALTAIENANTRIAELEGQVSDLTARLAAKEQTEQEFLDKFKNLSVSLTKQKKPAKTEPKPAYTDGFGA